MNNTFYIAFQIKGLPIDMIRAVKVTIEDELITKGDEDKKYAVNLCEHPHYGELKKYVENNP